MQDLPNVRFYTLYDKGIPPRRAPRDAYGFLPHRAVQYCEAVTLATGFGWWLFPPVDCEVLWDGHTIFWRATEDAISEGWTPIEDAACFPGWPDDFYKVAPEIACEVPPAPFLTALPEPGTLQINLGFCARANDGWGLLLRRPPNMPSPGAFEHFEGIIDPSVWLGPMFINVRLTRSHTTIRIRGDYPIAQIQPVPLAITRGEAMEAEVLDMGDDEWTDYAASFVEPASRPDRRHGEYAANARKHMRGGCPYSSGKA